MKLLFSSLLVIITIAFYAQKPSFSKKDSIFTTKAEEYVDHILGKRFAESNVEISFIQRISPVIVVYKVSSSKNELEKNSFLIYFKPKTIEVDSSRTTIDKKQIKKSIKGTKNYELLVGLDTAKKLAKNAGLKEGIKEWKISIVHRGRNSTPEWHILSTYNESKSGAYRSHSEMIRVSMTNGQTLSLFLDTIE